MKGCPECNARQKAIEERRKREDRWNGVLFGIIAGAMSIGLASTLFSSDNRVVTACTTIGAVLGGLLVWLKGDKFGTTR